MNKYDDHLFVLPEDDANRQLADGFVGHHLLRDTRVQVMPICGGWKHVLKTFEDEYVQALRNRPRGRLIMLIDFDESGSRRAEFEAAVPADLKDRVFVLGSWTDPQALKREASGSFEDIGKALAGDCAAGTTTNWDRSQLQHNAAEVVRLVQFVKPFLF
jgi:hypothetical protein